MLLLVQFTEMVMGHRKAEGVSSPRTNGNGALSSKAAEATPVAAAADDTAMVK